LFLGGALFLSNTLANKQKQQSGGYKTRELN